MATAHIESQKEEIASTVIMPGDPLRAKFIAEHFLKDAILVNRVRNILAYTGTYKGKKVTVFASGMGMPSMAIYAYELYHFYQVERIIRIGSVGAYQSDLKLFDLILVDQSFTNSNFSEQYDGKTIQLIGSDPVLNRMIQDTAKRIGQPIITGNIHCSDTFYSLSQKEDKRIEEYHCQGVEMESFALFYVAKSLGKQSSTILTVSNSLVNNEETTSEEREKSFVNMILLALETLT